MDRKIKILIYYAGLRNLNESAGGVCKALVSFTRQLQKLHPETDIDLVGDLVKKEEYVAESILLSKTPVADLDIFLDSYDVFLTAMHFGVFADVKKPKHQVWGYLAHCWNKSMMLKKREADFDFVVALSKIHKENLSTQYFADREILVVPNILDDIFSQKIQVVRKSYSVMFAGALVKHKGIDKLIEAFKKVKQKYPQAILDIYGDEHLWRDEENALSFARAELETQDICLKGNIASSKMPQAYAEHSILVLPSDLESFSLVCAEAQAQGCIPIAHNSGGVGAVVIDGQTGFLYTPNTEQIIAEKIMEAFALLEKDESIRDKAAAHIRKSFFADNVSVYINELFKTFENKIREMRV